MRRAGVGRNARVSGETHAGPMPAALSSRVREQREPEGRVGVAAACVVGRRLRYRASLLSSRLLRNHRLKDLSGREFNQAQTKSLCTFAEISDILIGYEGFKAFLKGVAGIVHEIEGPVAGLTVFAHQISVVASPDSQDGAEVEARRLVDEAGMVEVHPFDDELPGRVVQCLLHRPFPAHLELATITKHTGMSAPRIVDTCQRHEELMAIYSKLIAER